MGGLPGPALLQVAREEHSRGEEGASVWSFFLYQEEQTLESRN